MQRPAERTQRQIFKQTPASPADDERGRKKHERLQDVAERSRQPRVRVGNVEENKDQPDAGVESCERGGIGGTEDCESPTATQAVLAIEKNVERRHPSESVRG
jgi:hypothetical protein